MHSSSITNRRLAPLNLGIDSQPFDFNRWAIIIGISKYKYQDWNLSFADRDAEEMYNFLLTPGGGEFQPDNICKLINEQATQSSITKAFRSFLKKPKKEDLVIIYLACHGTPDIERLENVYLIAHDTRACFKTFCHTSGSTSKLLSHYDSSASEDHSSR